MTADPEFDLVASAARKWRMGRMFGMSGIETSLTAAEAEAVQMVLDLATAESELRGGGLDGEGGFLSVFHPDEMTGGSSAARKAVISGPPTWLVALSIIFMLLALTGWIAAGIVHLLLVLGLK